MSRVRYAKSMRDLERGAGDGEGHGAGDGADGDGLEDVIRTIRIVYETDAEVAQAVVPRPLEASVGSEVCVSFTSIATQLTPDVTIEARSASFGVRVDYDEKPGSYLLAMPMSSEGAVLLGRERYGQPAKLAELMLEATGGGVSASAVRKGVRFLSVEARRAEELVARDFTDYGYSFKAYPGATPDKPFDQDPQLVRLEWRYAFSRVWRLEGEFALEDSPFDPVADLPVRRIIEFEYAEGTVQSSGRVLRPVPGDWLLPFIHQRYDEPTVEGVDV
jgi:acetoacetate decarboxylase